MAAPPVSELTSLVNNLQDAVQVFKDELSAQNISEPSLLSSAPHPTDNMNFLPSSAMYEAQRIILACIGQIKYLVESPHDTILASIWLSAEAAAVRLAGELKIADLLAAAPDPDVGLSMSELAAKTKVDQVKLEMVMRLLVNQCWFREPQPGFFANGRRGHIVQTRLSTYQTVTYLNEVMSRSSEKIPEQIMHPDESFRYSTDPQHSGWNLAYQTQQPYFGPDGWLANHPGDAQKFNTFMSSVGPTSDQAVASDFPWSQIVHGKDGVVDIGGGRGTLSCSLAEKHPDIRQFIVQDLPSSRTHAEEFISAKGLAARVKFEAANFFTPQPRAGKGCYVYVIQRVLHDWSTPDCVKILEHLRDALGENSSLLIIDTVIPSGVISSTGPSARDSLQALKKGPYKAAAPPPFVPADFGAADSATHGMNVGLLGLCNAAASRTLPQWEELVGLAGLEVRNVYATRAWMTIMEVGLANVPSLDQ